MITGFTYACEDYELTSYKSILNRYEDRGKKMSFKHNDKIKPVFKLTCEEIVDIVNHYKKPNEEDSEFLKAWKEIFQKENLVLNRVVKIEKIIKNIK